MPDPLFAPGEPLAASKLQQLGDEFTFTPSLKANGTDVDTGTSPILNGVYWTNGNHVTVWFEITFGTSPNPGTGAYTIDLPVGARDTMPPAASGFARLSDSSTASNEFGAVILLPISDYITIRRTSNGAEISNSIPWTWAEGDSIDGSFSYLT